VGFAVLAGICTLYCTYYLLYQVALPTGTGIYRPTQMPQKVRILVNSNTLLMKPDEIIVGFIHSVRVPV
jgi:hypothetical protein